MSSHIRKISVGPDYKSSMTYVVGQKVLNSSYTIHLIQKDDGDLKIWIEREGGLFYGKASM